MSEQMSNDDLRDRLIDSALRETVGGEAPPDLSEQILAAAGEETGHFSTLGTGDEAMNTQKRKSGVPWGTLAVAASILFVIGALLIPSAQLARERAQKSQPSEQEFPAGQKVPVSNLATDKLANSPVAADPVAPVNTDELSVGTDFRTMVPGIVINEDGERLGVSKQEELSSVASGPVSERSRELVESKEQPVQLSEQLALEVQAGKPFRSSTFQADRFGRMPGARRGAGGGGGLGGKEFYELYNKRVPSSGYIDARGQRLEQESLLRRGDILPREPGDGRGPGNAGDQYSRIHENAFVVAQGENAVSTFSIDVDTASYTNVRQFLMQSGQLPPPDAVRIEELINYFDYDYSGPTGGVPFAAHVEVAGCPWNNEHRLVRVGIKGREIQRNRRPQSNLVFLIDVSGSMNQPNKLPLLVEGMRLLTRELGENDRVAIVVYASSEGLALASTSGDKQETILAALDQLRAGGSTAGGAGIELAYKTAQKNFIEGGVNRVILATDGDFNVGVTSPAELERMAEAKAKETGVFLTVLGFGRGNLNDAMMEKISGKGNGNYHYIDNRTEARKVLVEEMAGTLVTIAKDVKIQIEFNPAQVAGYRLIGYENRMLRTEDFNDDKKDAGEIGAGHTVTALYEIVPAGRSVDTPGADPLKYQQPARPAVEVAESDELLTLKIRYKRPEGEKSTKLEFPIADSGSSFAAASIDLKFAAAVASFGMLLRDSEHKGDTSYDAVLELAEDGARRDPHGYRDEFIGMVRQAKQLAGK